MEFELKPEERKPKYKKLSSPEKGKLFKSLSLLLLSSILVNTAFGENALNEFMLRGDPAIEPINTQSVFLTIDQTLSNELGLLFEDNVPLSLTNESGYVIQFEADGYNADEKIAYEWIENWIYYSDLNRDVGHPNRLLGKNEMALIIDYQFGDYIVIPFYVASENNWDYCGDELNDMLEEFILYYNENLN